MGILYTTYKGKFTVIVSDKIPDPKPKERFKNMDDLINSTKVNYYEKDKKQPDKS